MNTHSRSDSSLVIYDAGLAGTILMSLVVYLTPLVGLRAFDMAGLMASIIEGRPVAAGAGGWWLSFLVIFLYGAVLWAIVAACCVGLVSASALYTLGHPRERFSERLRRLVRT
ncbi:MAG: hypothetical protein ABL958_16710 [Bdellovibrionia bacterium]